MKIELELRILNNDIIIELDRECWQCNGVGYDDDGGICDICHGEGYRLTEEGKAIIDLVKRHG